MAKNDPPRPKHTAQEWCDIGNDKLAGRIPCKPGATNAERVALGLMPVKWVLQYGKPTLIAL